jgi:hypothetical protein
MNKKPIFWQLGLVATCIAACTSVVPAHRGDGAIRIVGEDRLLSPSTYEHPLGEPHLSTSPRDSGHLFVSAKVVKAIRPSDYDCATFHSVDGGQNWSGTDLGLAYCGNPWSVVLSDGSILFVALTADVGQTYRADLRLYRSADHGRTWAPGLEFGPSFDYPKIVEDTARNMVYVIGSRAVGMRDAILVARSTDHGISFPDSVYLLPSPHILEAQDPVGLTNGSLLVPFTEHSDSTRRRLPAERSWLLVSHDEGRTFSEARLISEGCNQPAGWARLASDLSGGHHSDRIYWMCARRMMDGIWLRYSDDVGVNWSEWIRIDRPAESSTAVLPAIAVNVDGVVGVMWLGRSGNADPCSHVFFSASVNGGESFLEPLRVSTNQSCPARDPRNAAAHERRPLGGGDYNGLAATADGAFHIVWADARDGMYRLRHASVIVEKP